MAPKIIISLVFVIIGFFVNAQSKKPVKTKVQYPSQIYLPEEYKSNSAKKFPVIIYLHGGSHRGNKPDLLKEWGPPKLIAEGKHFDFIIVSPQCPINKLWISDNWFEPLMAELENKYRVDTSNIYVTGISMGGFGAWQVAMDFPGRIKGIAPLCGSCADSLNICKIKHIPVWAFHGVNDGLVNVKHTDRLVKRLRKCGGDVKYSRLEKRHHGIWNLYDSDDIYRWFKGLIRNR